MIALLVAAGVQSQSAPLAYVVHDGADAGLLARSVAERLRDAGMSIVVNAGGGSMKSQMKRADASCARYAIIIGQDEASTDTVRSQAAARRRRADRGAGARSDGPTLQE
jgi:histidyl-tRNA synthetase